MKKELLHFVLFSCLLAIDSYSQPLVINEIQIANIDQFIDPSFNYGAWIELYNSTSSEVTLTNYKIRHTDSDGNVESQTLASAHGKIQPNGYGVVWFDHNSQNGFYGPNAATQIPFKLDSDGGIIEIIQPNGQTSDVLAYPKSIARCSFAKNKGGEFEWSNNATPGSPNSEFTNSEERLSAPEISATGGLFDDEYQFTVNIPSGTTLYYTEDGSTPVIGKSSISYNGFFSGNETKIYRFMLASNGLINSPVVTRSFIKNHNDYTLPVLCVNTAPDNFFDDIIGVYVRGTNGRIANNSGTKANQNMDWERPVNVEYFKKNKDGLYDECFNQEATFSIFGGWTRFNEGFGDFEYRPSFKIKSDKVYEDLNFFKYALFDGKPYVKIKNFLVRNGGQDQYARIWDAAIHEIIRTSGVYIDCQAWQPAHIFLNGKYLGMMNLREESNRQFAFSNYGIGKEEIDQWEGDITIKEGDRTMLNKWYDLSVQLSQNPTDTTIWNNICKIVDIDEYCNYMAAEIYMGNMDWLRGGFKNIKGFRAKDENGKFHIVMHDVDAAFGDTDMILQVMSKGTGSLPKRFCNMLKYEPFKKQFIDAYCIMNGSVFEPVRCDSIIRNIKTIIEPALQIEGYTAEDKAELLNNRISDNEVRRPALKNSLIKAFGLESEYNISISSNIDTGRLLVNNQEIPTGYFNGYLFPPISLSAATPDGYRFEGWYINDINVSSDSTFLFSNKYTSGTYSLKAVFEKLDNTETCPICINEISSANDIYINEYGKKVDWIELYNRSEADIDLSDYYISDDEDFPLKYQIGSDLPTNTIIPAYGYKIIWCDDKKSKTQIHAPFELENSDNQEVVLTHINHNWTDKVHYKSQPRWNTYGRYPDGGPIMAMFERPTIESSNRKCTSTAIYNAVETNINKLTFEIDEIAHIKYYNLNGIEIKDLNKRQILIQVITLKNGTRKTRKVKF